MQSKVHSGGANSVAPSLCLLLRASDFGFRISTILSLVALLVFSAGCSFNRDWKRAAAQPVRTNDISGAWIGSWRSDVNGHNGQLRCIMTPHSPNAYMARYRARFWKIFATGYTVPLSVTNINGEFRFNGTANLGALGGGIYTYEGTATPTAFQSTYNCKRDHGTFVLRRPETK